MLSFHITAITVVIGVTKIYYEDDVIADTNFANKGENIGEEERKPADKEDDENDYKSLGSFDIFS